MGQRLHLQTAQRNRGAIFIAHKAHYVKYKYMNIHDIREIATKVEAEITSPEYFYQILKGVKDMEFAKMVIISELTGVKRLLLELTKAAVSS